MSSPATEPGAGTSAEVLEIVAELAREVRTTGGGAMQVRVDDTLEQDIGFDSLERAELLLRLERAYRVRLPARTLVDAETPRDLVRAVLPGSAHAPAAAFAFAAPVQEPAAGIPEHAQTLVEVLEWHARTHAQRRHLTLLAETDAGPIERTLTYGELHEDALRVATGLAARGLEWGEAVVIMLPTSLEFFAAFFGILLVGGVPVPIYPPARRSQLEEHFRRQSRIVANALATMLITVPEARAVALLLRAATPSIRQIVSVQELRELPSQAPHGRAGARDIAFLQYTSGSTGQPKGVVLTHANVLANIRAMAARWGSCRRTSS